MLQKGFFCANLKNMEVILRLAQGVQAQPAAGVIQIQDMIQRVITISVGLAFMALTVMLVWSGIKYLTSGGEQKAIAAAHSSVTWALLGMLFLVFAYLLLRLIEEFTGVKVLAVCVGFPAGGLAFYNDCR